MYGVVLWSDRSDEKAVIWCEDHGDLAYYGGGSSSAFMGQSLDAGDLVYFEVTDGAPMRLASNPELVAESHAPALAERLRAAMNTPKPFVEESKHAASSTEEQSNVLQFKLTCTA